MSEQVHVCVEARGRHPAHSLIIFLPHHFETRSLNEPGAHQAAKEGSGELQESYPARSTDPHSWTFLFT